MKRSEMIEKLIRIYETAPKGFSAYHICDILLGAVEREGMLPPKLDNVELFTSNSFLSLDAALNRGMNKWEPEDEEK